MTLHDTETLFTAITPVKLYCRDENLCSFSAINMKIPAQKPWTRLVDPDRNRVLQLIYRWCFVGLSVHSKHVWASFLTQTSLVGNCCGTRHAIKSIEDWARLTHNFIIQTQASYLTLMRFLFFSLSFITGYVAMALPVASGYTAELSDHTYLRETSLTTSCLSLHLPTSSALLTLFSGLDARATLDVTNSEGLFNKRNVHYYEDEADLGTPAPTRLSSCSATMRGD